MNLTWLRSTVESVHSPSSRIHGVNRAVDCEGSKHIAVGIHHIKIGGVFVGDRVADIYSREADTVGRAFINSMTAIEKALDRKHSGSSFSCSFS